MLLDAFSKLIRTAMQHKKITKTMLLTVSIIFLIPKPAKYEISTKETFSHHLSFDSEWLHENPIKQDETSPNQTIFIKFTGSDEMKRNISEIIDRIKIRAKSIKLSRNDSFDDFFMKIYLYEDLSEYGMIRPIKSNQPNSDLIALMSEFYELRTYYEIEDVFRRDFHNVVEIKSDNTQKSIYNFINFLRCCININSHSHGTYYYLPMKNGMIRAESFFGFIICMIIHQLLDFDLNQRYLAVIFISLTYYFIPFIVFFPFPKYFRSVLLFCFTILNFRFGILYGMYIYLIEISQIILSYKIK